MAQTNLYQTKTEMKLENGSGELDHLRKMFIGGLAAITTEDSLRAFYGQWGDVVDSVVMRDPATRRSRGFGFVTFSESSMVDKAQASRPHVIDGKNVDSKRALPRPELGKSEQSNSVKKIFVGGLKENHDEQSLSEHFTQFGNVVSVKIPTDKNTSRKRGFAFIEFDDYDSVDKAVLHKNHTIKYVLVDVKKSVYKQELAKKQQQQGGLMGTSGGGIAPPGTHPGGYQQNNVYNTQAAYAYPPQMPPPPAGAYNGWGGYAQSAAPGYQQAPGGAPVAGYGAYGAAQQNGAGAAGWNAANPYAAQQSWAQNGYGGPAAPTPVPTAAAASAAGVNHGWNGSNGGQNFGDYQQTYNGGPQKANSLQGNRMNPYTISSAPNYGATASYVNNYAVANKIAKPIDSGATSRNGSSVALKVVRHKY